MCNSPSPKFCLLLCSHCSYCIHSSSSSLLLRKLAPRQHRTQEQIVQMTVNVQHFKIHCLLPELLTLFVTNRNHSLGPAVVQTQRKFRLYNSTIHNPSHNSCILIRHLQVQNCNSFLEVRICWFLLHTEPFVNTVIQCSLRVAPTQCCYLGSILKVFI